ncbi:hypothetical protein J6590_005219 [Homalodisca vitripennis]|nr:hypothetical protein J6590_005219 [Homalodisca vitripennis]
MTMKTFVDKFPAVAGGKSDLTLPSLWVTACVRGGFTARAVGEWEGGHRPKLWQLTWGLFNFPLPQINKKDKGLLYSDWGTAALLSLNRF